MTVIQVANFSMACVGGIKHLNEKCISILGKFN